MRAMALHEGLRTRTGCLALAFALVAAGCGGSGGGGDEEAAGGGGGAVAPAGAIEIEPANPRLLAGNHIQFTAYHVEGETRRNITADVEWSTSDPAVMTILNSAGQEGYATVHAVGKVTVTARLGELEAAVPLGEDCAYPRFASRVQLGTGIPPLSWNPAYGPDGAPFEFRLEDVACDESVNIVVLVLGTAWCGACTSYAMRLNAEAAALAAAGVLVVFAELETADYGPATSQYAYEHLRRYIGNGPGVRVGDVDTKPTGGFLNSFADMSGLPTVYVIRRSDMKVITTGDLLGDRSLVDVANDPEADWENPPPLPFVDRCAGAEEASEPNDRPDQATPLAPGTVDGGVCDPSGDLYAIDVAGHWRLDLAFSHGTGDLDMYVWDATTDEPLRVNGNVVGSNGATDAESFTHMGPALVKIVGYRQASAPYRLTLTAL